MASNAGFQTAEIRDLFRDEIEKLDGVVHDAYDDGRRLFLRGVLKNFRPVCPGDDVQAGVALRAEQTGIAVHPYVFRLICSNGAIWAHALETFRIADPAERPSWEIATEIREAIRACGSPAAFERAADEMSSARNGAADMAIILGALLSGSRRAASPQVLSQILENFADGDDTSQFGMMNAITAVARETRDPELRWDLEEFGGGVPAGQISQQIHGGATNSLRAAFEEQHYETMDALTRGGGMPELVGLAR